MTRCYIVLFLNNNPVHYMWWPTNQTNIEQEWETILDSLDRNVFEFDTLQIRIGDNILKKSVD